MSSESSAASSHAPGGTNRRRLLAFLGVGGLGTLAALFSRQEARAGHDGTNVMHIGVANQAPPGQGTGLNADLDQAGLHVANFNAGPHAAGVSGRCDGGTGVIGSSERGFAGIFQTATGFALLADGPSNFTANADRSVLNVTNGGVSDGAGAISAATRGGNPAVLGESFGSPSETTAAVAIQGVSRAEGGPDELGPGVGVEGISGTGVGVVATCFDGIALAVNGKAAFGTGGTDVIPEGQNSTFVPFSLVTEDSHISVTLAGDPGARQLAWVEASPGLGFTVHLTPAPARRSPETPFTFLVVEGVGALKG
jgi:hypothetical protein